MAAEVRLRKASAKLQDGNGSDDDESWRVRNPTQNQKANKKGKKSKKGGGGGGGGGGGEVAELKLGDFVPSDEVGPGRYCSPHHKKPSN